MSGCEINMGYPLQYSLNFEMTKCDRQWIHRLEQIKSKFIHVISDYCFSIFFFFFVLYMNTTPCQKKRRRKNDDNIIHMTTPQISLPPLNVLSTSIDQCLYLEFKMSASVESG